MRLLVGLAAQPQEPRHHRRGRDHEDAAHRGCDLQSLCEGLAGGLEHIGGEQPRQPVGDLDRTGERVARGCAAGIVSAVRSR